MKTEQRLIDKHVGELLSGFIDGELTQQEAQRVQLHCEECEQCQAELTQLRSIRESVSKAQFTEIDQNVWREMMGDITVKSSRRIGWLLLLGGLLAAGSVGVYDFLFVSEAGLFEKIVCSAIYLGFVGLFISVLRQRLIERKTDKYKDVEI